MEFCTHVERTLNKGN